MIIGFVMQRPQPGPEEVIIDRRPYRGPGERRLAVTIDRRPTRSPGEATACRYYR
jgi:hypothetical protein